MCPSYVRDVSFICPLYDSYIFKGGVFGLGFGTPNMAEEVKREGLQGNGEGVESLISRRHFSMHPYGYSYIGAQAGNTNPLDSELSAATSWKRVQARKRIGLAVLRSN